MNELADRLGAGGPGLLDVRPIAGFNGWPLKSEVRGGHIPGAVPFPFNWFEQLGDDAAGELLAERGLDRAHPVVVYCNGGTDAPAAAAILDRLGYGDVQVLEGGLPAWSAEAGRPVERLARFRQLVHPEWLSDLLVSGKAPELDNDRFVLAHVSFDNRDDYAMGHIPGAIPLDTLFLEEPDHWNRRRPDELEEALLANGIDAGTTVVLYGRHGNPTMEHEQPGRYAGQIAAMRAALLLLYAGVEDVRVLDGGLDAWQGAGGDVTTEDFAPAAVREFGRRIPARPDFIVSIDDAKEMLASSMAELVSMRSWREFIGEVSGYHYVGPRGRIPGAVFGNCGSDAYHMENYRNHDNTMLDYREIATNWREVGIVAEKHIAFYCGTGWRASEGFFCAYLMGWEQIAIYDGGWYEWSIDEGNPVATGVPEGPIIGSKRF